MTERSNKPQGTGLHPLKGAAGFYLLVLLSYCAAATGCGPALTRITMEVGNRLYPAFSDTVETKLNEKVHVGDTEYSFKTTKFYPHFAIIDSSMEFVSLSDEPVNPAFRIRVYKNSNPVEETWAFFGPGAPHYARTSFLTFRVTSFVYRQKVYFSGNEGSGANERDARR